LASLPLVALLLSLAPPLRADDSIDRDLAKALAPLEGRVLTTGVLYDRVIPLSGIERFDGAPGAATASRRIWRQLYDELRRASNASFQPPLTTIEAQAREVERSGVVPLALLDVRYERLAPQALEAARTTGRIASDAALVERRAFAATALVDRSYRSEVRFRLDRARVFANAGAPRDVAIDFDDGLGYRPIDLGRDVTVRYGVPGEKTIRVRASGADANLAYATLTFTVEPNAAPTPDDTLHVTATIPYLGQFGTGDAYVRLAPGHSQITNPVIVIEGFDLDNSMNWEELYADLNQQGLADSVSARGFDAIVLNFTDATDYIEKNAFVVEQLILDVQALVPPSTTVAVVGASMGGLCSRYALAYMETHAIPHRVRTWIAFDSPHAGADLPLGIQYWVDFFSSQSADAAALRDALNRPAARQMLVYHFTNPPTNTGQPDPLRASMLAGFAAVGDYPTLPRTVAIVDGSGNGQNQGFQPGDQIVQWNYSSLFVDITGNVWAVPDQTSHLIFDGRTRILFTTTTRQVTVSGTRPYDGAPGGWRGTMADMDAVPAPFGDIVALHPNHCFIPTISSLALNNTTNLFYDVAGDANLLSHTPFDAVYFPSTNLEHIEVTSQSVPWFLSELELGVVGVPGIPALAAPRLAASPNPFTAGTRIRLSLARAEHVTLGVYGIDGRQIRSLADETMSAGPHELRWDAKDGRGRRLAAGVYFLRLATGGSTETLRVVQLD
jgi:hypothetical protein